MQTIWDCASFSWILSVFTDSYVWLWTIFSFSCIEYFCSIVWSFDNIILRMIYVEVINLLFLLFFFWKFLFFDWLCFCFAIWIILVQQNIGNNLVSHWPVLHRMESVSLCFSWTNVSFKDAKSKKKSDKNKRFCAMQNVELDKKKK